MRIPSMLRLLPVGIVALALGACGGRAARHGRLSSVLRPGCSDRIAMRPSARSSTSSSSFKRTAASTIYSTGFPARTRCRRATTRTERRSSSSRLASTHVGYRSQLCRLPRRLRRNGELSRAPTAGWMASITSTQTADIAPNLSARIKILPTATSPVAKQSRSSTWASTTFWPTRCMRPT